MIRISKPAIGIPRLTSSKVSSVKVANKVKINIIVNRK